jgi:selenocysteine lyase/cysteine desulfurase
MLDEYTRRQDFPSLANMTYLNTAAEGIPPVVVGEAFAQYFRDHQLGMDGRPLHFAQWEAVRQLTSSLFGLSAEEVGICSSSSEAYNLAAWALKLKPGDEVVINDLDFPAGSTPWIHPNCPATVKLWRAREGALRVEDLTPLLGPRTRLVNTSLVSFYNGYKVDLPHVAEVVRKHSPALLAVDVTQALGRIPLQLHGADFIVSSTHKWILASHGGGLVGVRKERESELTVPAGGWFNLQDPFGEERFERIANKPGAASFMVGMPNFAAIYAIRAAMEYLLGIGIENIACSADPLVDYCLNELNEMPVELLTPCEKSSLAGIVAFRHPKTEKIYRYLHEKNIHVMRPNGRIRISIHGYNTHQDIDRFLRTLKEALKNA